MNDAHEVRQPDALPVTELERGLSEVIANQPIGGALSPSARQEMQHTNAEQLLGGLQRIAWAATQVRHDYEVDLSAYHDQQSRLRVAEQAS
ncbi:MAG: hypothetical protein JJT89_13535 [Nitriliruptoraceae bacterium]|nr:hypothetical protein [Nitriliruptoraceae bacterium]